MQVWTVVGVCILTGVVIYLLNVLAIPVGIILWTVVICFLLSGIVNGLEKRGVPRIWGTTIAYALMVAVIAALAVIMFSPTFGIGSQFGNMISSAPDYVKTATAFFNSLYDRYADVLQNSNVRDVIASLSESFGAWASDFASKSATGVISAGTSVANIALVVGFALVVAFWMLIELPNLGKEFRRIAGAEHAEAVSMFHATCTRVMGGYIKGTLLQCAIIGVGCGVLFAIIGTPNSAAFAVITGVLNIIPVVGPWLGGIVAGLASIFVQPLHGVRGRCGHGCHPAGSLHVRVAQDHRRRSGHPPGAYFHCAYGGQRHRRCHERAFGVAGGRPAFNPRCCGYEIGFRLLLRAHNGQAHRVARRRVLQGRGGWRRSARPGAGRYGRACKNGWRIVRFAGVRVDILPETGQRAAKGYSRLRLQIRDSKGLTHAIHDIS